MKREILCAVFGMSFLSVPVAMAHPIGFRHQVVDDRPVVQIALLLDTSNSMDGLIDQARKQLWRIVNETSQCRRDGKIPQLQVALYEYGNNNLSAGEGYVRMVLPLTDNLDLVSEKLFSLRTNGGSEFCGAAIRDAVRELSWSRDSKTYKSIFIAGNEPFSQGDADYRDSCGKAISRGVVVNTIHCGNFNDGVAGMWKDGAKRGEGEFMNIDQDRKCLAIRAPQDDEIAALSVQLNVTYVPYGRDGRAGSARQSEQDSCAATAPAEGSDVQRAVAKASANYNNAGWDLCDAVTQNRAKLEDIDAKDLPEVMQTMTIDQRKAYVETQVKQRSELQAKIQSLNAERERFVAEETKKQTGTEATDTLDEAMIKVVREQLKAREYEVGQK